MRAEAGEVAQACRDGSIVHFGASFASPRLRTSTFPRSPLSNGWTFYPGEKSLRPAANVLLLTHINYMPT
jgi:hypothetical protein